VDVKEWRTIKLPLGEVPAYKPVTNYKWSATADATPVSMRIDRSVSWAQVSGPTVSHIYLAVPDLGFYMANKLKAQCLPVALGHYDRWKRVKPSMASRASLGVFLYELREIKRMFEILPPKHFRISGLYGHGTKNPVEHWRDLLRWANNQHLSFNFGWKPFLKDIYRVLEALQTFNDRLLRYLRNMGLDLTRHVGDTPSLISIETYDGPWLNWWTLWWRIEGTIERKSAFQYSYQLPPGYTYDEIRWRAMLDSVGGKVGLSQIWDVVPWSFVLGWFINLSDTLDSMQGTTDWLEPYITFHQACYSVKAKLSLTGEMRNPPDMGQVAPVGSCDLEYYQRGVGLPEFSTDFETELSADKIRLLASLGASLLL